MKAIRVAFASLLTLAVTSACASAQGPLKIAADEWRCDQDNPKDTIIPVTLAPDSAGVCKATVSTQYSSNPKACRGRFVKWMVTNSCREEVKVNIGFSPFDNKNHDKDVKPTKTEEIKAKVRARARGTAASVGPCPAKPAEICGPAYKYDILIKRQADQYERLDLDPELEVEYGP